MSCMENIVGNREGKEWKQKDQWGECVREGSWGSWLEVFKIPKFSHLKALHLLVLGPFLILNTRHILSTRSYLSDPSFMKVSLIPLCRCDRSFLCGIPVPLYNSRLHFLLLHVSHLLKLCVSLVPGTYSVLKLLNVYYHFSGTNWQKSSNWQNHSEWMTQGFLISVYFLLI